MITETRFSDPDQFYDELCALHEHLDDEASNDLNARLVFILANQIGDMNVLKDCLKLAADTASSASANAVTT